MRGVVGDDAAALVSAAYRIGVVAALRSAKSEKVTGVVIAACGVRIVDPDGSAVIGEWESLADSAVNVADPEEFVTVCCPNLITLAVCRCSSVFMEIVSLRCF